MYVDTLLEILSGVHLSRYVEGPFKDRGGLMLVAPPSSLKSAVTEALKVYSHTMVLSDLNQKQLVNLREDIASQRITTMAFLDYEKLYQRHFDVAVNLEGSIKAMVAEGFQKASFEDQRIVTIPARCAVIGCLTRNFYARKFGRWMDDGFARRFLWVHYYLADPEAIVNAIRNWRKLSLSKYGFSNRTPAEQTIPYDVTKKENTYLLAMLREQPSQEIPYILLQKIWCSLLWKWGNNRDLVMGIMRDFAPSLTHEATTLHFKQSGSIPPMSTVLSGIDTQTLSTTETEQ